MPASRNPLLREQPWSQPAALGKRYDIHPVEQVFVPQDVDEATDFILANNPPEVAAYAGSPEVQRSVAREIASTLFTAEVYTDEESTQPDEAVLQSKVVDGLPPSPDARRQAVRELINRTTYRAAITPVDGLTLAAR